MDELIERLRKLVEYNCREVIDDGHTVQGSTKWCSMTQWEPSCHWSRRKVDLALRPSLCRNPGAALECA
jgi:hypothetical protein